MSAPLAGDPAASRQSMGRQLAVGSVFSGQLVRKFHDPPQPVIHPRPAQPFRQQIRQFPQGYFRMLQPHELAKGMGFPDDYKFAGKKKDQVKQIGNAVSPNLSEALIYSALCA